MLLETMSGKGGTEIGARFEQLKAIRDGLEHPNGRDLPGYLSRLFGWDMIL